MCEIRVPNFVSSLLEPQECVANVTFARYLSDYKETTLDKFFDSVDKWELHTLTDICLHRNDPSAPNAPIPFPIIYRIMSSPYLLRNEMLMDCLTHSLIPNALTLRPSQPPCAFPLLALDRRSHIQDWFEDNKSLLPKFTKSEGPVLMIFRDVVASLSGEDLTGGSQPTSLLESTAKGASLWKLLPKVLQLFSSSAIFDLLTSLDCNRFPRILLSHLSDPPSEYQKES